MINIAVLLTCFNRKELTVSCIRSTISANEKYNKAHDNKLSLHIFLTDDGCTDGTADAALDAAGDTALTVIKSDGNAFWAGGMRLSWRKALATDNFDYFLLLNDDTEVWGNLFEELFNANSYAIEQFGKEGIYSGNTTWKKDHSKISFGGKCLGKGLIRRYERLLPCGTPQKCDIVNANILMVSKTVVDSIGIFPDCYRHGAADNDYGLRSNKAGFPVLITAGFCGSCDADNYDYYAEMLKLRSKSICERIKYFKYPTRSINDSLRFYLRWRKLFVPILLVTHTIHIVSPKLYYKLFVK